MLKRSVTTREPSSNMDGHDPLSDKAYRDLSVQAHMQICSQAARHLSPLRGPESALCAKPNTSAHLDFWNISVHTPEPVAPSKAPFFAPDSR
eukprot:scaffold98341_cov19-Tisochrysis_lutea.AAC.1